MFVEWIVTRPLLKASHRPHHHWLPSLCHHPTHCSTAPSLSPSKLSPLAPLTSLSLTCTSKSQPDALGHQLNHSHFFIALSHFVPQTHLKNCNRWHYPTYHHWTIKLPLPSCQLHITSDVYAHFLHIFIQSSSQSTSPKLFSPLMSLAKEHWTRN